MQGCLLIIKFVVVIGNEALIAVLKAQYMQERWMKPLP